MSAQPERAALARVVGGASSRTVQLGVQVGPRNLGWTTRTSKTDYQDCRDYVAQHNQSARDCDSVRGFADLDSYPRMADSSLHGAGTPTR